MKKRTFSDGVSRCALAFITCVLAAVPLCAGQTSGSQTNPNSKSGGETSAAPVQPIPFSHKTHAAAELTCGFCHQNPDPGNQITFPTTAKCMACHSGIAKDKPAIRRLAQYDQEHQPVPWARVYAVPGFVYWSHRTHSEAGLKCESCHGQVDQMDVVARTTNVTTMGGCVDCHRQKEASTGCKACHESQSSRLQFPSGRVLPQFRVEASLEYWLSHGFFP
ncbi:MAG: hypothetical protein JWO91_1684 [Acidobacteriaceae bacterium]|nr:hypothetical protein [Acidobacteriaceae bacterium]